MMSQRFPALAAALCVFAGLAAALLAGFGPAGVDTATAVENGRVASPADAEFARAARALADRVAAGPDVATLPALVTETAAGAMAVADKPEPIVVAALPDASQVRPIESQPVRVARAYTPDPVPGSDQVVSLIDIQDECFVLELCIDHYLWALYERTAKQDTSKVHEWRKVKVRKKGKTVTVRKRFTRLVDQDFTWKDPKAAERAGMPMIDYVIGGMDLGFKMKLFQVLRAAEKEGLSPGITSAFRDDYRQSIASGLRAAANRSYHGGSLRGGYGRGMAADVVSVQGATRAQRWVSSESLWKWIDANEQRFGVGRPYLNKDPAHVAPLDGEEYVSRRGTKTQHAQAEADVRTPAESAVRRDRPSADPAPVAALKRD